MKLKSSLILYWIIAGVVLGVSVSQFASATGNAFLVSQPHIWATLVLIGLGLYLATLPIYRYRLKVEKQIKPAPKRPNPFLAFRLLVLSRAVILTAAGFTGWHLGQALWLISFSVSPAALVFPTTLGIGASVVMLVFALLADYNCRLPKDPSGEAV